jgi:hypothetical protein
MRTLRVKQEKSRYPGWLRDLNEYEVGHRRSCHASRSYIFEVTMA